jgi:hypothetical protein
MERKSQWSADESQELRFEMSLIFRNNHQNTAKGHDGMRNAIVFVRELHAPVMLVSHHVPHNSAHGKN